MYVTGQMPIFLRDGAISAARRALAPSVLTLPWKCASPEAFVAELLLSKDIRGPHPS